MKRLVLAVTLSVGAGSAALAADLPPPMAPPPRAPATYVPAPIPYYNWTGFYIGGNVGYGFTSSSTLSDSQKSTFTSTTSNAFLGGGQVGVNWEFGPGVVIGAEADFDWLPNTKNTVTATGTGLNAGSTATATINSRWLTLVDARLGYAWDRLLVYGKGGGAFVGANNSSLNVNPGNTFLPLSGPANNMGWNAGVGLEYAFWGGWSAKAEYDYVRLNSASFTAAGAGGPFNQDVISTNNRVINLVLVGINYKFGPWW
ncbi:MAG: outer membrane protein [Xanthobacteraceae bacterium]